MHAITLTVQPMAVPLPRSQTHAHLPPLVPQYLDGISVNDDVLNNPANPLLVINQRLQITLAERNRQRSTGRPSNTGARTSSTGMGMQGAGLGPLASPQGSPPQLVHVQAMSVMAGH